MKEGIDKGKEALYGRKMKEVDEGFKINKKIAEK